MAQHNYTRQLNEELAEEYFQAVSGTAAADQLVFYQRQRAAISACPTNIRDHFYEGSPLHELEIRITSETLGVLERLLEFGVAAAKEALEQTSASDTSWNGIPVRGPAPPEDEANWFTELVLERQISDNY